MPNPATIACPGVVGDTIRYTTPPPRADEKIMSQRMAADFPVNPLTSMFIT
jgi:hypothetical protein